VLTSELEATASSMALQHALVEPPHMMENLPVGIGDREAYGKDS
jgi:hypothetical protein